MGLAKWVELTRIDNFNSQDQESIKTHFINFHEFVFNFDAKSSNDFSYDLAYNQGKLCNFETS